MKKIGILSYGAGNIRSVKNAVTRLGGNPILTCNLKEMLDCSGIIIPGVGAFPTAMNNLEKCGAADAIRHVSYRGVPIFGICLGMQLMFDRGYEDEITLGLGLLPGEVKKMKAVGRDYRLPSIGKKKIDVTGIFANEMFRNVSREDMRFYFLHSYSVKNAPESIISSYYDFSNEKHIASVCSDNLWGAQFHPEKSGETGLRLIENFLLRCVK